MTRRVHRTSGAIASGALIALLVAASAADAQRRLGGGGGGMRARGGSMHANVPTNFHGPGSRPGANGGGVQWEGPRPGGNGGGIQWNGNGPRPGPNPGPGPRPPVPVPVPVPVVPPAGWGWGWGWDDDPFWDFAAGAMVAGTTAAVIASASQPDVVVVDSSTAIGSVVYGLPSDCPKVIRANITYYSCNNVWYRPQYLSSGIAYIIVSPP